MSFFATTSASREAMLTEKRSLERDHASRDGMSDQKRQRPTLANEIVEAVKMDSLQKLCSTLEPLLRRVVHFCSPAAFANFFVQFKGKISPLTIITFDNLNKPHA
jgi:DNA-binding Xre family transcriptional regulator